jgi:hypothetical protein
MLIQRPIKQFGFRTYTADFAAAPLNPTPPPSNLYEIQTVEVDGDLDTIYALINGGLQDDNIAGGANINGSKLATATVPVTKLVSNSVQVALANTVSISTVETAVGTLPPLTTIGGHVRLEGGPLQLFIDATTSGTLALRWYEDGVVFAGGETTIGVQNLPATSLIIPLPVPTLISLTARAAAAHTYMLTAQTSDAGIRVQTAGAGGVGNLYATELA